MVGYSTTMYEIVTIQLKMMQKISSTQTSINDTKDSENDVNANTDDDKFFDTNIDIDAVNGDDVTNNENNNENEHNNENNVERDSDTEIEPTDIFRDSANDKDLFPSNRLGCLDVKIL